MTLIMRDDAMILDDVGNIDFRVDFRLYTQTDQAPPDSITRKQAARFVKKQLELILPSAPDSARVVDSVYGIVLAPFEYGTLYFSTQSICPTSGKLEISRQGLLSLSVPAVSLGRAGESSLLACSEVLSSILPESCKISAERVGTLLTGTIRKLLSDWEDSGRKRRVQEERPRLTIVIRPDRGLVAFQPLLTWRSDTDFETSTGNAHVAVQGLGWVELSPGQIGVELSKCSVGLLLYAAGIMSKGVSQPDSRYPDLWTKRELAEVSLNMLKMREEGR